MDLLGMPTGNCYGAGIGMGLVSSDVTRKPPGMTRVLVTDLGKFRGRHSPKQINTIQGAAEKQDGFVPLSKQKSCLFTRPKATRTCVFHTVFASDLDCDLQGHPPSQELEVILCWGFWPQGKSMEWWHF